MKRNILVFAVMVLVGGGFCTSFADSSGLLMDKFTITNVAAGDEGDGGIPSDEGSDIKSGDEQTAPEENQGTEGDDEQIAPYEEPGTEGNYDDIIPYEEPGTGSY
jgi:hypothetical protein